MKLIQSLIFVFLSTFLLSSCVNAQNDAPEWVTKKPVKRGYVYGVGVGASSDLPIAADKAKILALRDLTDSYENKLETFAMECDTVLGPNNEIHSIITTIKLEQEALLKNIATIEKKTGSENNKPVVYLLLRINLNDQKGLIKEEIDKNIDLYYQMKKNGLLEELNKL